MTKKLIKDYGDSVIAACLSIDKFDVKQLVALDSFSTRMAIVVKTRLGKRIKDDKFAIRKVCVGSELSVVQESMKLLESLRVQIEALQLYSFEDEFK